MLEYSEAFLKENREALERLKKQMTPAAYEAALKMARRREEVDIDERELEDA